MSARLPEVPKSVEWLGIACSSVLYLALLVYIIPRHEPWADEAQAWQVASHLSLGSLFSTYIHYEASPGLWHTFLWLLTQLHVSYTGMHWAAGISAFTGVWLLLTQSPFPLLLRLILPFTYFLIYQYAVIARSYVLFFPILCVLAILWRERWRNPVATALVLGIFANLSIHSLAISVGLVIALTAEWIKHRKCNPKRSGIFPPAALLAVALAWAVWCVFPKADAGWVYRAHSQWIDLSAPSRAAGVVSEHPSTAGLSPLFRKVLAESIDISKAYRHALSDRYQLGLFLWALLFFQLTYAGMIRYVLPTFLLALVSPPFQYHMYHAGLMWLLFLFLWWITLNEMPPLVADAHPRFRLIFLAAVSCCVFTHLEWAWKAIHYDAAASYSPNRDGAVVLNRYLTSGREVVLDIPQKTGKEGTLGEFFVVGLEPYFSREPIRNMTYRFWFWGGDEGMRKAYLEALSRRPVVLVEESGEDLRYGKEEAQLVNLGFVRDRVVCGRMFYPDGMAPQLCHAFYKPR
jgi:hypothetical protein